MAPACGRLLSSLNLADMLSNDPFVNRRILLLLSLLLGVITLGTAGYMIIEGWSLADAAYMTFITLSTVGFMEVLPLTEAGRWFTILLIITGVGSATYLFGTVANYIVAGELRGTLEKRRMQRDINALKDHYIVCGYGRVGEQVVKELIANGARIVVIDKKEQPSGLSSDVQPLMIVGDGSDDDVLRQAGIERASGLVAACGSDAENVFITMSARALNRDLLIITRGIMPDSERKLRKAGANHVILPHAIGGRRMAGILLQPTVVDFLDVVMHSGDLELWLREIRVGEGAVLCNQTVGEIRVRSRTGANVLAIKTARGQLLTDVNTEYVLRADDVLVALGTKEQLASLDELAGRKS